MTDTPRTDAQVCRVGYETIGGAFDAVTAEFSRKLERELNQLLEMELDAGRLEKLQTALRYITKQSDGYDPDSRVGIIHDIAAEALSPRIAVGERPASS